MRGISPRLGGVGWAASFAGFISCVIYNILLGVAFTYLTVAGDEPWKEKTYTRPEGCGTADRSEVGAAELYLYYDVTKVLGKESCQPFSYGDASAQVNENLLLDTTNAGVNTSIIVSVTPNIEINSGVAVTVGAGKTMVIDVLQIGDL